MIPEDEINRLTSQNEELKRKYQASVRYIRDKVDQLLSVMSTSPLKPEELDDETLIEVDPIGIVSNSFVQILRHLKRTNKKVQIANTNLEHEIMERKQAQEELIEIIDFFPDPTFVIDNDKKVIIWNKAMEAMTEVCKVDIIGKGDYAYTVPFYGEKRKQILDLLDGNDSNIANKYKDIKKKGNILYAETFCPALYGGRGAYVWTTAAPLFDEKGIRVGAIETIRDITEQVKTREALHDAYAELELRVQKRTAALNAANKALIAEIAERRQAEAELQLHSEILENMSEGVFMIHAGNGKIVYSNPIFESMFGYDSGELIGKHVSIVNALSGKSPEETAEEITQALNAHGTWQGQVKSIRKDGTTFWCNKNITTYNHSQYGKVWISINQDITDRKQLEDSLLKSEKNLKDITSSLAEGIYVEDENRHVTFMNKTVTNILGWTFEELADKDIHEVIHFQCNDGTPLQVEDCCMQNIFKTGVQYYSDNEFFTRKDGTVLPVSVLSSPILEDGKIVGIVTAFRDISERKRLEQEAIKAQKLESIGILAGGIAHDFNNLMQAIIMGIGVAKIYASQDDKANEILSNTEKVCATAKELSNRLLTFSRGGAPLKRPTSMAVLLRESAGLALSGSNIICDFSFPDTLCLAEVDEGQMRQVIHNLLINAKDAMPDKGRVAISAENVTFQKNNSLSLRAGRYLKISVSDQGKGIPQKYLSKIFDPYFSTKGMGSKKGTGLGLTICHSIIDKHGGTITVESRKGAGTTFHIYLPAAEGQIIKEEQMEEIKVVSHGRWRILLMDDEESVRDSVQKVLEAIGYETVTTATGEGAIEAYVKAQGALRPFDAVILDLTVRGGMGGDDAIRDLLKIDPGVKAIVTSGYKENPILKDFKKYGFVAALAKPYNIHGIQELLDTFLK
ncbi:MAG: PAS domain S-box protein [Nitrospirae bacterium]|nr:PAS domain S-box protein [Nitrospirota bacterium]